MIGFDDFGGVGRLYKKLERESHDVQGLNRQTWLVNIYIYSTEYLSIYTYNTYIYMSFALFLSRFPTHVVIVCPDDCLSFFYLVLIILIKRLLPLLAQGTKRASRAW